MGRYSLLNWILEIRCNGAGWIQFVQDKDQWPNRVHMVLSFSYLYKVGNNKDQLNDYQLQKTALLHGFGYALTSVRLLV
jgi:hypothetical protein